MRVQAKSPGRAFPLHERVLTLKLTASDVGEAISLAAVLTFIQDEGIGALAEMAIERPFSQPRRPRAAKGVRT